MAELGLCIGAEGLTWPDADITRVFTESAGLGVRRFRMLVDWRKVDPAGTGVFAADGWKLSDRLVNGAVAAGLKPLLILMWVSIPFFGPSKPPPATFQKFAAAAAARYAGKVSEYEIWNEPNELFYFGGAPDPVLYTEYLKRGYAGIKSVLPGTQSKVIFAGCPPEGDGPLSKSPLTFVKMAYNAGARGFFDVMGHHPYTIKDTNPAPSVSSPSWVENAAIRAEMVARGDSAVPMSITEVGYNTSLRTQNQQVADIQAIKAICDARTYIETLYLYNYRNSGTNDTSSLAAAGGAQEDSFGLVKFDWTRKAAFAAIPALVGPVAVPKATAGPAAALPPIPVRGSVPIAAGGPVKAFPPSAVAAKVALTHVWVGSTHGPFTDFGKGVVVQFGSANSGDASTDGRYFSGGIHTTPAATADQFAEGAQGVGSTSDRGNFSVVRSNAGGTEFVCGAMGRSGGSPNSGIYVFSGGVMVPKWTSGLTWGTNDKQRITCVWNGSHFVYQLVKNGVPVPGATWTDTGDITLGFGKFVGFGFEHRYAGGTNYKAPGLNNLATGNVGFLGGDI